MAVRIIKYKQGEVHFFENFKDCLSKEKLAIKTLSKLIKEGAELNGYQYKYEDKQIVTTISDPVIKHVQIEQHCEPGIVEELENDLLFSEMQKRLKKLGV
jgi:hypothetical protein